jgi:hypothetical protein
VPRVTGIIVAGDSLPMVGDIDTQTTVDVFPRGVNDTF